MHRPKSTIPVGFPTIRALFGGPYNKEHSILGSILGPPICENSHVACAYKDWFVLPVLLAGAAALTKRENKLSPKCNTVRDQGNLEEN